MNLTLTAKVRILPNEEQQSLLLKTRKAYMDACNEVSDYISSTRILNVAMLNKALYRSLREKYGLKSQMAQSVLRTVTARYKTILENQHEWIRPEFRHAELISSGTGITLSSPPSRARNHLGWGGFLLIPARGTLPLDKVHYISVTDILLRSRVSITNPATPSL